MPQSGECCLAFIKMTQESGREILHSCRPEENLVVKTFSYLSKECLELMLFSCAQCSMGPGQAEPYCVSYTCGFLAISPFQHHVNILVFQSSGAFRGIPAKGKKSSKSVNTTNIVPIFWKYEQLDMCS